MQDGDLIGNYMSPNTDQPEGLKQALASLGVEAILKMVCCVDFITFISEMYCASGPRY